MLCDPQYEDCDHLVKTCFLRMTSAISEAQCGTKKLWSRGRSNERKYYTKFGRNIGQKYLKALASADPISLGIEIGCVLTSVTNLGESSFLV